jgi:hypothetical protein
MLGDVATLSVMVGVSIRRIASSTEIGSVKVGASEVRMLGDVATLSVMDGVSDGVRLNIAVVATLSVIDGVSDSRMLGDVATLSVIDGVSKIRRDI